MVQAGTNVGRLGGVILDLPMALSAHEVLGPPGLQGSVLPTCGVTICTPVHPGVPQLNITEQQA